MIARFTYASTRDTDADGFDSCSGEPIKLADFQFLDITKSLGQECKTLL